ncbi:zinc ribbon domain-containing protein [Microbacterium sp. cx-59]|uniref:zinc ribbon domain-containing protein n=1 Tax=Microbacterium sp. cx-59 TaxID=2891207 RepID=UPI001E2869E6|nr:C4-type zinc ribbon domain-containing protein [Microbacterium sp. cx-59]MCC4907273.1 C4-type zinc ribbon domain-containing protein [Microbacterium sp. cx-59]
MNAAPADQLRLLDLAATDTRRTQADAARRNPPQAPRLRELAADRQALARELGQRQGTVDDLQAELRRIESDVAVVDARRARDNELMRTTSSAKDATAIEHELASLQRRKDDLEETQLDLMERLEAAQAAVDEQQAVITAASDEYALLASAAEQHIAEAAARLEQLTRDRAAVASGIPAALVTLYDKLHERSAGAALVQARTCLGCHMMLTGSDLNVIRQAAEDAVVTCPQCDCILVRTPESGL